MKRFLLMISLFEPKGTAVVSFQKIVRVIAHDKIQLNAVPQSGKVIFQHGFGSSLLTIEKIG